MAATISMNVHGSIDSARNYPLAIVCSSFDPHRYVTARVLTWLRGLARRGAIIGGVETGAWILARAGLMYGYRATIVRRYAGVGCGGSLAIPLVI